MLSLDSSIRMSRGFYVCGSYGSGVLMNLDERKQVFKALGDYSDGVFQLIAHVGTTNLRDSILLAQHAEEYGGHRSRRSTSFFITAIRIQFCMRSSKISSRLSLFLCIYMTIQERQGIWFP